MKKTYLDLSTGHLSRDTRNFLEKEHNSATRGAMGWPAMTIAAYEYGWFITVPDFKLVSEAQMDSMPHDLGTCLLLASAEGAELLRFDADGYIDGDLPYYQEI